MAALPSGLPPTFTTKVARELGIHSRDLYRWRDDSEVVELSRGVFRRGDAPPPTYPDLLAVATRVPGGIVCGLSAASLFDLTDTLVAEVQIAVRRGTYTPRIDFPPTEVLRFEAVKFDLGRTTIEAAPGEPIPVYDPARTVVDLMRLRHRFGEPIAHSALRRYIATPDARPAQLLKYAAALGVSGPVRAAVDVASAR
ncbi:type IV toxin-antitoxin system AbiEi family antitoxin domain-containing protein [Isoptericola sp. BMS4]|uniref:type IV toxin-antitoxin system AbiEi family antitoxin domain-containing protein n=1 Tax=Isoptericola sp. BMS4 TaxID=2527875 RepID=UPI00141DC410|nr:type IV toxin-antitoxin system AbiEi family antitoxin domain-containing protein [Isoptericola sp. BMS4]